MQNATLDATDLYNIETAGMPDLEIDYMLMHTLFAGGQSSVVQTDDGLDFDFTDQGLYSVILDKLTQGGYDQALPLVFSRNQTGTTLNTDDFLIGDGDYPVNAGACIIEEDANSPDVWGWMVRPDDRVSCYRYLVVNTSEECVLVNDLVDYNGQNVDLFLFNGPGAEWAEAGDLGNNPDSEDDHFYASVQMDRETLSNLQESGIGGGFFGNGFCYYSGTLSIVEDDLLDANGQIFLPPYSVMVLKGDVYSEQGSGPMTTYTGTNNNIAPAITSGVVNTWNQNFQVMTDIVLSSGTELHITNGATITMAPLTSISVMDGARLLVDDATITSCDEIWHGIYVEGDPNDRQDFSPGVAEFYDATIEHALTGVSNHLFDNVTCEVIAGSQGGLIIAENTLFINNRKAVGFNVYKNVDGQGVRVPDLSYFEDCEFTLNDAYPLSEEPLLGHFTSWRCHGMRFEGCTFIDERSGLERFDKQTGIYMGQSSIRVWGDDQVNTFKDLYQGIHSYGAQKGGLHIEIKDNYFECWNGIFLSDTRYVETWNNDFTVIPAEDPHSIKATRFPVGLYLSTDNRFFHVEGNRFCSSSDCTDDYIEPGSSFGIVAVNRHGLEEQIYRNEMHFLTAGFESVGQNRFDDLGNNIATGLQLLCNFFEENTTDIFMTKGPFPDNGFIGIRKEQGGPNNPSFNTFGNPQGPLQILNGSTTQPVDYYSDPAFLPPSPHYPSTIQFPGGIIQRFISTTSPPESCPVNSIQGPPGDEIEQGLVQQGEMKEEYELRKSILLGVVDGGDTEGLKDEVILATNTDAWEKYGAVMAEAGYVSEEVLKEVAQKEGAFSHAMIRDILLSNAHAPKSAEVMSNLEERSTPLPEYMVDQIKTGLQETSPKEHLQSIQDEYHFKYIQSTNDLLRLIHQDGVSDEDMPVLIALMTGTGERAYDYELLELYDSRDDTDLATLQLYLMENEFGYSETELQELERYKGIRDFLLELEGQSTPLDKLNEEELSTLNDFVGYEDMAERIAHSVLKANGLYAPDTPVLLPESDGKKLSITNTPEEVTKGLLSIFPNPAHDYFTVDYRVDRAFSSGLIRVVSDLGVILHEERIVLQENQKIISERFPIGTYRVEILVDGKTYKAEKLVIR